MRQPTRYPDLSGLLPAKATVVVACAGALMLAIAGCSPAAKKSTAAKPSKGVTAAACVTKQKVTLTKPGTLTVATDSPVFPPWFINNKPANGKGFESAVAYAVAKDLGFSSAKVAWVKEPFNNSYAPGKKNFDFDINEISITAARAEKVDFSAGYYTADQAIVVLKSSKYAKAKTLADFKDATIGSQVGTTSLTAAQQQVAPAKKVQIFDDSSAPTQELKHGQLDGLVVDLPTADYIASVEMNGKGVVAGRFAATPGHSEPFGMLFEKGNPLVGCVNLAIKDLRKNGTLDQLDKQWLSQYNKVPVLS